MLARSAMAAPPCCMAHPVASVAVVLAEVGHAVLTALGARERLVHRWVAVAVLAHAVRRGALAHHPAVPTAYWLVLWRRNVTVVAAPAIGASAIVTLPKHICTLPLVELVAHVGQARMAQITRHEQHIIVDCGAVGRQAILGAHHGRVLVAVIVCHVVDRNA